MKILNLKFQISLFQYYHWVINLLLSLFPLTVFLALRVIKLPWLIAGIGAILASHFSTDGLYGLDPPSFLWRGYGLSSQLFGMVWMPLAIAWSWRFFERHETRDMRQVKPHSLLNSMSHVSCHLLPSVFFLTTTAMGHLGLGIMAMLSLVPLAFARPMLMLLNAQHPLDIFEVTKNELTKLLLLSGTVIFFLSYWIVPIFLADNYHNISFWDPPWKFASYGAKETITRLFNGDLFDWGRGPWMTALVIVGLIAAAWPKKIESGISNQELGKNNHNYQLQSDSLFVIHNSYFSFSLLFLFWLLMYFGRGTWGGLIDLIPGMKEFHLSRFIVGVHVAGLFLVPIGIHEVVSSVMRHVSGKMIRLPVRIMSLVGLMGVMGLMLPPIYKQTIEYAKHNDRLILQARDNYEKVKDDEQALFTTLRSLPPGRVFAGRGGWWGKDFRVAETPYYMQLSTYGLPTVLWLPETWSPNSDVEQYFNEDKARDYDLFGIRYVAAPPKQEAKKFWKLIIETKTWKLYEIDLTGGAAGGIPRDAQLSSLKPSMEQAERNASTDGKEVRGSLPAEALAKAGTRQKSVGYFTTGVRPAVVATDKRSYGNVVRFWIQSDAHEKGLYPELTFAKDYPRPTGLPNFKMLDEVTYLTPNGSKHNLFAEPPVYMDTSNKRQETSIVIKRETNDGDMIFTTTVDVPEHCTECIVVLKQSFHPNWRATIDGELVEPFTVFPFYLAVSVPAGTHDVVFSYEPSRLKVMLLTLEFFAIGVLLIASLQKFRHNP